MTETTTTPTPTNAAPPEQATSGTTEPTPAGKGTPPEQKTSADAKQTPAGKTPAKQTSNDGQTQNKNRGLLLKAVGDAKPADQQGDPKASEETGETAEKSGDQAEYGFAFPEDFTPDAELIQDLKTLAGANKLSQAEAQKLADLGVKLTQKMQQAQAQAWETAIGDWVDILPKDPEYGGSAFEKNVAIARLAFDDVKMREKFGVELVPIGLKQLLGDITPDSPNGLSLGNHPEVFRFFYRVGKLLADDAPMLGGGGGGTGAVSEAAFYANMFNVS